MTIFPQVWLATNIPPTVPHPSKYLSVSFDLLMDFPRLIFETTQLRHLPNFFNNSSASSPRRYICCSYSSTSLLTLRKVPSCSSLNSLSCHSSLPVPPWCLFAAPAPDISSTSFFFPLSFYLSIPPPSLPSLSHTHSISTSFKSLIEKKANSLMGWAPRWREV